MASFQRSLVAVALSLGVALLGLGCLKNAVVFSTSTRLGIELNAAEAGRQGARVGYKRFEGVTMPVRKRGKLVAGEAYPVFAGFRFATGSLLLGGLGTTVVEQHFATGDAANAASGSEAGIQALLGGSFIDSNASRCLRAWTTDAAKLEQLGDWLEQQALPREPTEFLFSDAFGDDARRRAVDDLGIDCEGPS